MYTDVWTPSNVQVSQEIIVAVMVELASCILGTHLLLGEGGG